MMAVLIGGSEGGIGYVLISLSVLMSWQARRQWLVLYSKHAGPPPTTCVFNENARQSDHVRQYIRPCCHPVP